MAQIVLTPEQQVAALKKEWATSEAEILVLTLGQRSRQFLSQIWPAKRTNADPEFAQ